MSELSHVFHSFKHFAHAMQKMEIAANLAIMAGPEAAAHIVHKATVKKFGSTQPESGPFEAWAPLQPSTIEDRHRLGYMDDDAELLRTGELRDSYEVKSEGFMAGVGSALGRAEGHELGDPTRFLPARPALGPAFAENEKEAFEAASFPLMALLTTGRLPMRRSTVAGNVVDVTD